MNLERMTASVIEITAFLCLVIACGHVIWMHIKGLTTARVDHRKHRRR
jgi:hypothetical protein